MWSLEEVIKSCNYVPIFAARPIQPRRPSLGGGVTKTLPARERQKGNHRTSPYQVESYVILFDLVKKV